MEKFIFLVSKNMSKTSPVNSWLNSIPNLCKTTHGNINENEDEKKEDENFSKFVVDHIPE